MSEKKYLDWQGLLYYHSKQKTEIQDLFGNVNSDITKINNNITNIDLNLSEIETNISNIQNTLDELDENDPLFVDSPAYDLTQESVNYLLEEYNNKPNYLIVNDVTRTQNDIAFVNITYDNNNEVITTPKYYLRSADNNLAGIITASDYLLLHSLNKTSAIGDENLLYNGQNINTNISGVGFSSTENLLHNNYSVALRSSSTNPFLGLKQGNNLWYAQASNNYFYFGPTSTKALRLDLNGNGLFTGSLTANQIIKSGGTNNLFLKADGSVDSNTYLTDSSLDDYYNKTEIDELLEDNIPTKTSDLTNDSGFITTDDIPEGSAASTTVPLMDGTANVGSELAFARGDHRHPTDTTRQPLIDTNNKLSADLISSGTTNKVVTQSEKDVWDSKQETISDLETIRSGASLGATALQSETDPTVPTHVKSITQADITNWNNKLSSAPVTSVNGQTGVVNLALGDTNVIESIKVNDSSITPDNKSVNIEVPTKTSELVNDSKFIIDTSYEAEYLTIEFLDRDYNLYFESDSGLNNPTIQISTDKITWTEYVANSYLIDLTIPNLKIYLKGTDIYALDGTEMYSRFISSCPCIVSGNILSLAYGDNFRQYNSTLNKFSHLFSGLSRLQDASNLILPSTGLTEDCFSFLFMGCQDLTKGPDLLAETLSSNCYEGMFYACTSLNYVKCLARNHTNTNTNGWIEDDGLSISTNGVFVRYDNEPWDIGVNGVPPNWIIRNNSDYNNVKLYELNLYLLKQEILQYSGNLNSNTKYYTETNSTLYFELPSQANNGDYIELWINTSGTSALMTNNDVKMTTKLKDLYLNSIFTLPAGIFVFKFTYFFGWNGDYEIYN